MVAWGISGGAARAIALFEAAKVCIEQDEKPDLIIGTSSGALLSPIIAVAYEFPPFIDAAIEFARSLSPSDMFPYEGNFPLKKNGKPSTNAIFRVLTGYNHLAWQDIAPLYKRLFKQRHFEALQNSSIKCFSFCVDGTDGSPKIYCLNDAESLEDMIVKIKKSSRIVPIVQNEEGFIDGGFISFNPAMWLFDRFEITKLVTIYSKQMKDHIKKNPKFDKNFITTDFQVHSITAHWLGWKDAKIEELYCQLHGIEYLRIECPDGFTDELYEDDDHQLIALGEASRKKALEAYKNKDTA